MSLDSDNNGPKKPKNKGKKSAPSGLPREDLALWKRFTGDIEPMHEVDWTALEAGAQDVPDKKSDDQVSERAIFPVPPQRKTAGMSAQLDRRTQERLRKGQMEIEGRVDLHGLTQPRAYDVLKDFITAAQRQGKRCVLVITGKGRSRIEDDAQWVFNDGILRQQVPAWLSVPPLSDIVLKHFPAQPKDGGEGAYYVYLRRVRDYSL
jgi:DNA-nicking Smr family endonuclease